MNKVFTLILVIGISIGLLLGSSINILVNKNHNQSENIKKNQFNETINKVNNEQKDGNNIYQTSTEEPLNKNIEEEKENIKEEKENAEEEYVNIIIQSGFTSNKVADILYQNELILNKNDFLTLLRCLNLSSKLRVGEKSIKRGSSMMEIIDIVTN